MQLVQVVRELEQALQGEVQSLQRVPAINLPDGHSSTQFVPSKNLPVTQVVQVEAPEQAKQGEEQAVQTP
jgi:hypothetical protein